MKQVTAALFAIRFAEAGEAVAVGNNGAILTRGPGATDWVDRTVDGVEAALLDVRFGPDGEAVIVAANGTILTRGVGNNAWIVQTLDGVSAYLRDVDFGRYGEAVIVGDGGTILTRAPGRTEWNAESVDGVSDDLRTVRFGDNGDVVIIGRGTILTRSSDNQDWIARFVHQVSTRLSSVDFGPNDEAMVLSSFPPIIFATTNEYSSEIGSAKTEDELRTAFYELPEYEKSPLLLERLSAIEAQRKQVKEDLKKAESEIAEANSGRLSRRQRLEEFQKHMEDCAPKGSNAAEIAACAQALENVVIRTEEDAWWEQVAEQVPPAVLLLFLLATLGSLYRYNLRMAAFYHGRADALELSKDVLHKETFDRIAETLAGDGVQFRGSKTPIDNVTEIANTLISKLDLKKAS